MKKEQATRFACMCALLHVNTDCHVGVNASRKAFVELALRLAGANHNTRVIGVHWGNMSGLPYPLPKPLFWLFFPDAKRKKEWAMIAFDIGISGKDHLQTMKYYDFLVPTQEVTTNVSVFDSDSDSDTDTTENALN